MSRTFNGFELSIVLEFEAIEMSEGFNDLVKSIVCDDAEMSNVCDDAEMSNVFGDFEM